MRHVVSPKARFAGHLHATDATGRVAWGQSCGHRDHHAGSEVCTPAMASQQGSCRRMQQQQPLQHSSSTRAEVAGLSRVAAGVRDVVDAALRAAQQSALLSPPECAFHSKSMCVEANKLC